MYAVGKDKRGDEQIEALPGHALASFAEVMMFLELTPWAGKPGKADNPNANILTKEFGPHDQGLVYYLILEEQRRVEILEILWLG